MVFSVESCNNLPFDLILKFSELVVLAYLVNKNLHSFCLLTLELNTKKKFMFVSFLICRYLDSIVSVRLSSMLNYLSAIPCML